MSKLTSTLMTSTVVLRTTIRYNKLFKSYKHYPGVGSQNDGQTKKDLVRMRRHRCVVVGDETAVITILYD